MPPGYDLTPESITFIVGVALSLILAKAPQFRETWQSFDGTTKRLLLLAFCVIAAGTVMAVQCVGVSECYAGTWQRALTVAIAAWGGTQGGYVWGGGSK